MLGFALYVELNTVPITQPAFTNARGIQIAEIMNDINKRKYIYEVMNVASTENETIVTGLFD